MHIKLNNVFDIIDKQLSFVMINFHSYLSLSRFKKVNILIDWGSCSQENYEINIFTKNFIIFVSKNSSIAFPSTSSSASSSVCLNKILAPVNYSFRVKWSETHLEYSHEIIIGLLRPFRGVTCVDNSLEKDLNALVFLTFPCVSWEHFVENTFSLLSEYT